jgi:hypothetical protein
MSKSQLIVTDLGGVHNADLEATRARLIKGGSWKRQRIVMILPAADMVPAKCVLSWLNLAYPPNNGVCRILALGQEVGEAYSNAIENVLAHPDLSQWEFVLCIEQDNAPPGDGVIRLVDRMEEHPELAAIGGLYFTKGEGGVAQVWGDPRDPCLNFRPQPPVSNELLECVGTGMGFTLFRMSMFKDKRFPRPLFRTKRGLNGEGIGTQDLTFWTEARKLGYRCAVDCACRVGHYDQSQDMMW